MTRRKPLPTEPAPTQAQLARQATVHLRTYPHASALRYHHNRDHYRTGDGEVLQHLRPGSMHAYTLPSRGFRT